MMVNSMPVDSNYIPTMRKSLDYFCDEIHKFHLEQGIDWSSDSPAAKEHSNAPLPNLLVTTWSMSSLLIELGSEHVSAFVSTITEPIQPIACWTCVRSMLESCSVASWLLEPNIGDYVRVGRGYAIRYAGMEQCLKYLRVAKAHQSHIQDLKNRIRDVEREAIAQGYQKIVNRNGKRIGIGQRMPSATEIIKLMLDKEEIYRVLSAVSHGYEWAIRNLSYGPVDKTGYSSFVGGSPVMMFKKEINPVLLCLLGITAVEALVRPVWYKCIYSGWDKERLASVLDSTFDSLGIKSSQRFWRV